MQPGLSAVCVREIQKDLEHSAKSLIEDKIRKFGVIDDFIIRDNKIITPGDGVFIFQGMQNHTADSVKSLEGFDVAWIEEAQSLGQRSLDLLRPTIRKPGSEIWASWNPCDEEDPIDQLLRGENPPKDAVVVEANYIDNPQLPEVLLDEMEADRERDFDKYLWVWLGQYRRISDAIVFKNWEVREFETADDALFRFGMDFGYAADPSVLVRCYLKGKDLFIDHEACEKHVETDFLPDLMHTIPEADKWPVVADSARPETISFLKRHGFPKMFPAAKGKGSIEDGVEFLKSYNIVVHPRCRNAIKELKNYSYKVDENDKILPVFEDRDNHVIDALRYACESARNAHRPNRPKLRKKRSRPAAW